MPGEAKVLLDMYQRVQSVLPVIGRFPRSHRFTIGQRLEERLLDTLEALERARYGLDRKDALAEADARLRHSATLLRLACDVRFLSQGQYGDLSQRVVEVGRQIGGWRKQVDGGKPGGGPV